MPNNPSNEDLREYEEESMPFDDAMRQLLQAKPKHREAEKPKAEKSGKKPEPKNGGKP